ncbi:transglycosylase domain-containing protein [Egbenema bharatensis]|uniref:transglycosylase domain-containing protein n=1 Tax=Egbenema bharatensis TaxID=3463334 RepID=UPI003A87C3BC
MKWTAPVRQRFPADPGSNPPPGGNRPLYQRWWAWGLVGIGFGVTGAAVAGQSALRAIDQNLPNTTDVLTYNQSGTLTIKSADGEILQQMGPATRENISLQDMPDRLVQAFIASEDEDFYEHNGVNYQAILRATLKNIRAGEVLQGGSTITQQLARVVFLDQDRTLARKLREALLAQKMERELTKDQILERYLNLVYLGSNAYGVADAAWIYFSKPVDELTLSESAMIAGTAPAPSVYSPLINPDLATQRRNIVLQRMLVAGFITLEERDAAMAEPLALQPSDPRNMFSEVPYFTSYVQQQLPSVVSPEQIEIGGLTVETTLNLEWQRQAQDTVAYAIRNYGPGQGFEQAALVAIDPRTGEIKALVGGDDFEESQFNRATQAQRQPGSTFKTFVYAVAVAGGLSPYNSYLDAKLVVDGYEPQNYGRRFRGSVSMRDALISSINVVAVKALIEVGFEPVVELAHRMGIRSDLLPAYSLALGSSEVNLLELTSAYGTLANEGNYIEPHGITRVFDRFGNLIYEADFVAERALDAETASIMTWMLEGVVNNGTGWDARLPDRSVAGKTGTSEERRDLWFVGYIPQLAVGVWLGNDDSTPTYGASSTAALTWYDFVRTIREEIPVEEFPDIPYSFDGREPTIELDPVKPGRIYEASSPHEGSSDTASGDSWGGGGSSYSGYGSSEPSYSSGSRSNSGYSGGGGGTDYYSEPEESYVAPVEEAAPAENIAAPAIESAPVEEAAPPPPMIDEPPPPANDPIPSFLLPEPAPEASIAPLLPPPQ